MTKTKSRRLPVIIVILLNFLLFASCTSSRKALYFANQGNDSLPSTEILQESPIQANDLLSITINSLNPEASSLFNTLNVTEINYSTPTGGSSRSSGYLVDSDGYIQFPMIGNIKATGLTKSELKNKITNELVKRKLLVDPIVSIRYLNFKVTILGEVAQPTVINVPSEKITLMEALGLAGDLTIYAKRDNVLIIREEGGQKLTKRVNLNTSEIFGSPFYYLKSNDVVYVEPTKAKVSGASSTRLWLPLVHSGLSFSAIILDRVIN